MTPEWRRRLEQVYHAALMRPADEHARFLAEACAGDEALRREVQSMLESASRPPGPEAPTARTIAAWLASDPPPSSLMGRRIGVYQLQERIGAGGMGEVYRARDTQLGRDVAVKILPAAFTGDPDRLARFEREARVLAAFNHPNIAAIHGVEQSDGIRALIMELVEGETLADRVASAPMPIPEALAVARQIVEALQTAHAKGIVHRDLKPANIKVTPAGTVKLLDFGLAKTDVTDTGEMPAVAAGTTREGVVIGTAAYMSPEQACGREVDKRTDIWSFGCVLYEMLTGRAAFGASTVLETTARVLGHEPAWDLLPEPMPLSVRVLLTRCLEKDPQRRLRDVADARFDLEEVLGTTRHDSTAPPRARSRTNLPQELTSFVGRQKEIADVKQRLVAPDGGEGVKLLTLTGVGGTGKTRLSLRVAADLLDTFPDGVWFIELAALVDPALVPQTVATTLGLRETAGSINEALTDFLREKQTLLILDNCEHVVDACAQVAESLLRTCPNVQLLASSREELGIAGEVSYRVTSLSTPDPHAPATPEELTRYEAVHLFVERAAAALPGFALTRDNAPAIAQITHRLDGIPLALELAAARVKVLRAEQISARLDDRFRLLTTGTRTALPRHQTLRASIDWSYDLLSSSERTLLRRLSVFAGGWSLEAAEAVCAGDGIDRFEVLDCLTQLLNKSLIVAEQGDEPRYRLLETIRQYAKDKLFDSGDAEAARVRNQHLDYFLRLMEEAEPKLRGSAQLTWLNRLETEHDNLRTALDWSLGANHQAGLRLAGAAFWFWMVRGHYQEALKWLNGALATGAESDTRGRAKALAGIGFLLHQQGDLGAARTAYDESLRLWRDVGDRWWIALVLDWKGWVALYEGDTAATRSVLEEAVNLARGVDDRWALADALISLGTRAERTDHAAARAILEESIAIWRKVGDRLGLAEALYQLGTVENSQNEYGRAATLYRESLALFREARHKGIVVQVLFGLGSVVQRQGDNARAAELFAEALALTQELGNKAEMAFDLAGLGGVAAAEGRPARAARLLASAESIFTTIGISISMWPYRVADYDRWVALARAQLDEAAFSSAWAEGRALTVQAAIAYALAPDR